MEPSETRGVGSTYRLSMEAVMPLLLWLTMIIASGIMASPPRKEFIDEKVGEP